MKFHALRRSGLGAKKHIRIQTNAARTGIFGHIPIRAAQKTPETGLYRRNSSSRYFGNGQIWSSTISSNLSMWRRISSKQTATVSW